MDEETEHAKKFFHDEGWSDYVKSEDKELSLKSLLAAEALWDQPQSVIERWYIDGWNEAKESEQKMGNCSIFTLTELRKRMEEAIEWYGEDFHAPIAMITSVLRKLGYNEAENNVDEETEVATVPDETPRNPSLPPEPTEVSKRLTRIMSSPDTGELSGNAVPYAYATSYQHMFVPRDGVRHHTFTANGIIALPDRNIVFQRDFEGTDSESLEQAMEQWCQRFIDLLRNTEIRVISVSKDDKG